MQPKPDKYEGKTKNGLDWILLVDGEGFYLSVYYGNIILTDHIITNQMTQEELLERVEALDNELSSIQITSP